MEKICFISTEWKPILFFLKKIIIQLSKKKKIYIICSNAINLKNYGFSNKNIILISYPIARNPEILNDLKTFFFLIYFFNKNNFQIVTTITPKAGLLGVVAAFFTSIKNRVHIYTGQVWVTKFGLFRKILKFFDKIIYFFSSSILIDSVSQKKFLIKEKIIHNKKVEVILNGSINGVDLNIFKKNLKRRISNRKKNNIKKKDLVFLYLGRFNFDKGIDLLLNSYLVLAKKKNIKLIMAGDDEQNYTAKILKINKLIKNKIIIKQFTSKPHLLIEMSDILVLPSRREGFGKVVIEANAMKVPVIVSNIPSLKEIVKNKKTGLIFNLNLSNDLLRKMTILINDKKKQINYAKFAYYNCLKKYDDKKVISWLLRFYDNFK